MVASIPTPILEAALDGSLCYKHLTLADPEICPYFDKVPGVADADQHPWVARSAEANAPGVYVRYLVENAGQSLTVLEYLEVVAYIRECVSGRSEHNARDIDCAFRDNQ